jgi:predicted metal-dependent TIM-barrel fold hydrolase
MTRVVTRSPAEVNSSEPRYFDAALEPSGLTRGDLEQLAHFGVRAGLVRAAPSPRPRDAGALVARWEALLERELPRLAKAGIAGFAVLGIPPEAPPTRGFETALHRLVPLLGRRRGAAIGPIGLGDGGAHEATAEHALRRHLEIAREIDRPLVVQLTSRSSGAAGPRLRRLLELLDEGGADPARVLFEGAGRSALRILRERGYWVALRPGQHRLTAHAAAEQVARQGSQGLLLASGAGSGHGDLLAVAKVVSEMEERGLTAAVVRRVAFTNAAKLLRIDPAEI